MLASPWNVNLRQQADGVPGHDSELPRTPRLVCDQEFGVAVRCICGRAAVLFRHATFANADNNRSQADCKLVPQSAASID
jgi:hypothetical protein